MSGYFVTALLAFLVGYHYPRRNPSEDYAEHYFDAWTQAREAAVRWERAWLRMYRELVNANRGLKRLSRRKP